MQGSFTIGRVAGIEIGVHYTWLIVFVLFTWSLASGFFPAAYPGWDAGTYWITAAIAVLLLFVCVLVHELSHSLVAKARGQQVHSISLFMFGGVSNLEGEVASAGDEFLIAIVGPLTSFALAILFWLVGAASSLGASPAGAIVAYLTLINVMLGAFNLVPGFPLDGGRVLRSILWGATGSLARATRIASYVGQGVGWLLIVWGVWQALGGNFLNGLWIAFIGWFLNSAAEQARQQQAVQERLSGVRVADIMNPEPATARPGVSVQEFMVEHAMRRGQRALLVMTDDRLVGIVTVTDAKEVPQEAWATTPISDIMTRAPLKSLAPDTDMSEALRRLVEEDLNQAPVVQGDRVVGLLSRADVMRFLQFHQEIGGRLAPGRRGARTRAEVEAAR